MSPDLHPLKSLALESSILSIDTCDSNFNIFSLSFFILCTIHNLDDQIELLNSNNENNDGDMLMQQLQPHQQVAYQGAIVSVRGSLAFWKPTAPNTDGLLAPSLATQFFGQKRGQPTGSAPGVGRHLLSKTAAAAATAAGQLVKCPPLPLVGSLFNRRSNLFEPSSSSSSAEPLPANAARWPEVLAVEGTTIKLNLVIVGHRLQLAGQQYASSGPKQLYGASTNTFRWTQNNQAVVYNAPRSRFQQQQLPLNENDINVVQNHHLSSQSIAARFSAFQNNTSSTSSSSSSPSQTTPTTISASLSSSSNFNFNQAQSSPTNTAGISFHESFMLAPHLNEPLISRLESSKALETKLASALQVVSNQARRASQSLSLVDDFLASGQQIDWQKLEAYLRFDSNSLRLDQLITTSSGGGGGGGQNADPSGTDEPLKPLHDACPKLVLEQFNIIQVEINHLSAQSDGGLYQLQICPHQQQHQQQKQPSQADINQTELCQLVAGFQLHVMQDIPRLESKAETLLLEPGDRLSIKCEATGFTLPQITWFLDNLQLNEHQQQLLNGNSGHSASTLLIDPASSNLLKIRIGDYVSQDNHVHSFVNASSVQVSDGGFYKCQANNGFHMVELGSRIDVRGPPIISRQLNNINVLVGQSQLHIQCPYSGYPISGVEWYYRPNNAAGASTLIRNRQQRAKRWPPQAHLSNAAANLLEKSSNEPESYLDADKDPDPDKDEWLSQANSMTTVANSDDYPDPLPDYPSNLDYDGASSDLISFSDLAAELEVPDYSDLGTDFQQQQQQQQPDSSRLRRKRDSTESQEWIKFPQSRRHQIHPNGTLILHDVVRSDQGFYRCRVLQASKLQNAHQMNLYTSLMGHLDSNQQQQQQQPEDLSADSNEFQLIVSVPPVISPFASTEALREGMRNFLTCSVIEGDPPVRLHWLKDGLPIEEHLQMQSSEWGGSRIRVETSNEYTSTLFFSQVEFDDSGNYTCM